jgi:hypothetical protein
MGDIEENLYEGPPGSQMLSGFTYVSLTLLDAWSPGAPAKPMARILGGPRCGGTYGGWSVSLKVGETVGILLVSPVAEDRNYYSLHRVGVFNQRADGGYSNGELFTKRFVDAAMLGQLIAGLWGTTGPCPYDEEPDFGQVSPVTPAMPPDAGQGSMNGQTDD